MRSRSRARRPVALGLFVAMLVAGILGADAARAAEDDGRGASKLPPAIAFNASEFGTDFTRRAVPLTQFATGAFRGAIPAIDRPRFAPAREVRYLRDRESVIELAIHGKLRAYPVQVLIWHEIVNDRVAGVPVAVTYCPLCNSAIAFDRRVKGRTLSFEASGKLRNANLVMIDRETETWWQQFGGTAIVGRLTGSVLKRLPARIVPWGEFRRKSPLGQVLLRPEETPYPYGVNPYAGSDNPTSAPLYNYSNAADKRLPPKARVVYIERRGEGIAVPLTLLERKKKLTLRIGGKAVVVRKTGEVASPLTDPGVHRGPGIPAISVLEAGRPVPFDTPFWFAVAAFVPDVRLVR